MGCFQCAPPSADLVGLLGTEVSNAEGAADRVDVELLLRSAPVDRVVVFDSDAGLAVAVTAVAVVAVLRWPGWQSR